MGLEKIVLAKIADVDAEIAEEAAFYDGTLFLYGAAQVPGMRLYRVINAVNSVVNCSMQLSEADGNIAIDFV